jgi:1-deoxy-D-xylulose-5-phosphate synthase
VNYQILNKIDSPADLKALSLSELQQLCHELRSYIIEVITQTGGHLAPSLGVVEITVALHYIFDTPKDKLIWDVGHQAYPHKVLTCRREELHSIRQFGGISGFCKRSESEYDAFGAGHASTSISAALGFAAARNLERRKNRIVAVIGDGALTGGLALEGLNNVSRLPGQFLVILNDNEMSISPNVGSISEYLTRIVTSPPYLRFKSKIWNSLSLLPKGTGFFRTAGRKALESFKNLISPGLLFEELGLRYYGPIDGHDLAQLIKTLRNIKDLQYPILFHVLTKKGKGSRKAEENPTKYHGISPVKTITEISLQSQEPSFSQVFGQIAIKIGPAYPKAVFITAAMCAGTGLTEYAKQFPERFFDVGIAEGHAVTFAAGLAAGGYRPIVAIYSTFLQRAYDHIIHDVALQKLPVIFALDRAGIVGEDGPTHHGAFDLSYLSTIPNLVIAAPRDGDELKDLLFTALEQTENPFAIRYPRGSATQFLNHSNPKIFKIGSWKLLEMGRQFALIGTGVMTNTMVAVASLLKSKGLSPTLVHARFIKPFDDKLLEQIILNHEIIFTLEDNTVQGGFGVNLKDWLNKRSPNTRIVSFALPDQFIPQGSREELLESIGLDAETIANKINSVLNFKK